MVLLTTVLPVTDDRDNQSLELTVLREVADIGDSTSQTLIEGVVEGRAVGTGDVVRAEVLHTVLVAGVGRR